MENRSFDHFLGWLPGADGQQAGLVYFTSNNVGYNTYPWAAARAVQTTTAAAASLIRTIPRSVWPAFCIL